MNDAQLDMFRQIAEAMRVPADRTWNYVGPDYIWTGITKQEALDHVAKRGCGKVKHNSEFPGGEDHLYRGRQEAK